MKTHGLDIANSLHPPFSGPLALEWSSSRPAHVKQGSQSNQMNSQNPNGTQNASSPHNTSSSPSANGSQSANGNQTERSSGPTLVGTADPYYSEVRARIQSHVAYPSALARKRLQGQVQVTLALLSDGTISSLDVAHSSGSTELDHLALESVRAAVPFPPFQASSPARKLELPIDFRLH